MTSKISDSTSEFIEQLDSNKGILYKVARLYCFTEDEQKDLIQEISLQAWRSFPKFNREYKFSTWLYKIALNVAISNLRKENKRKEINSPFKEEFVQIATPNDPEQKEHINLLYQIIGEFKAFDKAMMLLFFEEKTYKEISEIMGISESNVATKLSRLKKSIKKRFIALNQK